MLTLFGFGFESILSLQDQIVNVDEKVSLVREDVAYIKGIIQAWTESSYP